METRIPVEASWSQGGVALLRQVLDEWSPKLGIDGAAIVLASNVDVAEALTQWIDNSRRDHVYSITALSSSAERTIDPKLQKLGTITTTRSAKVDHFTHAFSHIGIVHDSKHVLRVLKDMYFALLPKGIAVVTCSLRDPLEEVFNRVVNGRDSSLPPAPGGETIEHSDLLDLAEDAHFERGKVRIYSQQVVVNGKELEGLIADLKGKLETALQPCDEGHGWRKTFDQALSERLEGGGGLRVDADLVLAMRWDELKG